MNKRPTERSPEVLYPAMEELYDERIKDLDDYGEREQAIDDLVKNYASDGYEFGKNLEDCTWDVDFSLCDALHSAFLFVDRHYKRQLTEWYKSNPVTLHKVGDEVIVKKPFSSINGKACIVTSVKPDIAQYSVVDKEKYKPGILNGFIFNHEDLTPVEKEVRI